MDIIYDNSLCLIRVYDSDLDDHTFSFDYGTYKYHDDILYSTVKIVFNTNNLVDFTYDDSDGESEDPCNLQLVNEWNLRSYTCSSGFQPYTLTRPGYTDTNKFYFENLTRFGPINSGLASGKKFVFGQNIALYYTYLDNCKILMRPNKQITSTEEECTFSGTTISCNFENNEVSIERIHPNVRWLFES